MEFKEIAPNAKIPVVGLGTWNMGGGMSPDTSKDEQCIEALREGIKLGMVHIDTAEMYASGHAEELVREAIKPFDRDKLFITSKVWQTNLRYNDLIKSAKASLKRLGIDCMDLYLVHWPNPSIPLNETMRGMGYLLEQGLTKFVGVSNFDVALMKEAQSHLDAKIVANQVRYNLLDKEVEKEVLPYCQKNKITLVAYSPLGKGGLMEQPIKVVDGIAKKYGKSKAQVLINWLISKNQVVTIPKATKLEHVKDNAGAIGWKLDKEDMGTLDKI